MFALQHGFPVRYLHHVAAAHQPADKGTTGMNRKPQLTFWQIWNMCFGFLGIQFAFAPVSYTHLDVYKRQFHGFNCEIALGCYGLH